MKFVFRIAMLFFIGSIVNPLYSQQGGIHINSNTPIDSILLVPEAKAIVEKYFPGISTYGKESAAFNEDFTFPGVTKLGLKRKGREREIRGRRGRPEEERAISLESLHKLYVKNPGLYTEIVKVTGDIKIRAQLRDAIEKYTEDSIFLL